MCLYTHNHYHYCFSRIYSDFQDRIARQGGIGGAGHKVTVRNLRIREDTPKYLRNLDLNSNISIYIYCIYTLY